MGWITDLLRKAVGTARYVKGLGVIAIVVVGVGIAAWEWSNFPSLTSGELFIPPCILVNSEGQVTWEVKAKKGRFTRPGSYTWEIKVDGVTKCNNVGTIGDSWERPASADNKHMCIIGPYDKEGEHEVSAIATIPTFWGNSIMASGHFIVRRKCPP